MIDAVEAHFIDIKRLVMKAPKRKLDRPQEQHTSEPQCIANLRTRYQSTLHRGLDWEEGSGRY
jgi:hypothetical protein